MRQYIAQMTAEDILAYLRLSHYDSHQFARYLPRLLELASNLSRDERKDITKTIEQVWAWHFPLGEELDLAYHIACLFYELDDYQHALIYFKRSLEIYGLRTGTLYNIAACHQLLEQHKEAEQLVRTVLKHDPENQQARALLAEYEASASDLPK